MGAELSDYDSDIRSCACRIFGTRTRFVLMPLVLLCLSFTWANILSFNLAMICLNNAAGENATQNNHFDHTHTVSSREQTYAIAAMAVGALVGNFLVVYLVSKIGIRIIFGLCGIISSAATLLMPLAIHGGFGWLIVCRVVQGVSFSANFPAIGAFSAKWIYYKQNGLFVSVLVSYVQVAPIFTSPVGGAVCDSHGWEAIFYVHGGISAVLFVFFILFYRNSPGKHPFVSPEEVEKVSRGKTKGRSNENVPYLEILKTPGIWAIWIAAAGNFITVNVFFVFTPTYLSQVLKFSVTESGLSGMYPPFAQLVTKVAAGLISDKITSVSEVSKYILFNTFSFFGSAAIIIALAYMGDSNRDANSPVMAVALAILGINTGGFFKAAPALSKQYSPFVTGFVSQCNCLVLLIIPFFVEFIAPDNTVAQWKIVFLVIAASLILTNIVFVVFVQGEPFEWTHSEEDQAPSSPTISTTRMRGISMITKPDQVYRF